MSDPWGADEPPTVLDVPELPPRLAVLAEMVRSNESFAEIDAETFAHPEPEDLPEVQALVEDGWEVLDDTPYYAVAPAAWPSAHRAWVRDRLPRFSVETDEDGRDVAVSPWSDFDRIDARNDYEWLAAAAGLPSPPDGRIWLLRSPRHGVSVADILEDASDRADAGPYSDDMFFGALTEVLARL